MATYLLIQNVEISKDRAKTLPQGVAPDDPAKEIAKNIRDGNLATTEFGGWNIPEHLKDCFKPGDRLLFYRSGEEPCGYFATGRVLCAADAGCRELRKKGLLRWFETPEAGDLGEEVEPGLAAYRALDWKTGKGKIYYINAQWDVVVDPQQGRVLVEEREKPGSHGCLIDEEEARRIREKCARAENALFA